MNQKLEVPTASGITCYMFRAECASDAHSVRAALMPWLLAWTENRDVTSVNGLPVALGDVTVSLSIVQEGPSLSQLRWILDVIPDAHVAAESLMPADEFTGERAGRERWNAVERRALRCFVALSPLFRTMARCRESKQTATVKCCASSVLID